MNRPATSRRHYIRLALALLAAGFLALCVLINEGVRHVRLDLTEGRLYTLSEGTRRIARRLDEPVELRFFYSRAAGEASPYLDVYAARVRELLAEIAAASAGKVRITVIDPAPFSEEEDHAEEYGLTAVPLGRGEEHVYFGLAGTNATDGRQVIPFFQPEREPFLEYDLARLLQQLGTPRRPVLGLLTTLPLNAAFDPRTQQMREPWAIVDELRAGFEVRMLPESMTEVPADVRVLAVVHPQHLPEVTLFAIDQYVLRGGRLLLFLDPSAEQAAPATDPFGPASPTRASDLAPLLRAWGLQYDARRVLLDDGLALAVAGGERGEPMRHPAFLGFGPEQMAQDDALTATLQRINVATPGILAPVAGQGTRFEPLLWSSDVSASVDATRLAGLRDPADLYRDFKPTGERHVVAARISGRPRSAFAKPPSGATRSALTTARDDVHVVVVADTDLLADLLWVRTEDLFGQRYRTPWASNGDFVLNAVDNLAGSDELIALRGRRVAHRPFTRVEELRRLADERLRQKARELESALGATERRLAALEASRGAAGAALTQAQERELRQFQQERARIRRDLRSVRHDLDDDIESLGRTLKLLNILVAPLVLVALVALIARWLARRGIRT